MRLWPLIWMMSWLLVAGAEEALAPTLRTAYLQAVPGRMANAYCDYRGRMWYTAPLPTTIREGCVVSEISLAPAIRAQVEKQWAGAGPVVVEGGEIALFEPGGRVWIVSGRELLGYDGQTWRQTRIDRMEAACAGHGRAYGNPSTWAVGRMCFFCSSTDEGIVCFDGERNAWILLDDPAARQGRKSYFWSLAGLRDGSGLVAFNRQPNEAWIYRQGRWSRLALPRELEERRPGEPRYSQRPVRGVAADTKNNLWILVDDSLFSWSLDQAAGAEPPPLRPITSVGPYQLAKVSSLLQEHNGTLLATVESVRCDGRELGGGLLIVDPNGQSRFLASPTLARATGMFISLDGRWLMVQAGNEYNDSAGIVDLHQQPLRYQSLDLPDLPFLQCAGSDGRHYVKDSRGEYPAPARLYALDLSRPDERQELPALRVDLQSCPYGVASDGSVWASVEGQGLSKYQDGRWQVLLPLGDQPWFSTDEHGHRWRKPQILALWPGRQGSMLAVLHDRTAILFDGEKQVKARSVRDLVAEHPALVADRFSGQGQANSESQDGIAADKLGNVYLQETSGKLDIYVAADRRWKTVSGTDYLQPPRSYGNGRILLSKREWNLGPAMEVKGEPPNAFAYSRTLLGSLIVGDLADGLFALEVRPGDEEGRRRANIYRVLRLGAQDDQVVFPGYARPQAWDPAGILWTDSLGENGHDEAGSKPHELRLFKGDQCFQRLELEENPNRGIYIAAAAPGSVYAWTKLGLHHYSLTPAQDRYMPDRLCRITCGGRTVQAAWHVTAARQFLVGSAGFSSGCLERPAAVIYLVPLPEK